MIFDANIPRVIRLLYAYAHIFIYIAQNAIFCYTINIYGCYAITFVIFTIVNAILKTFVENKGVLRILAVLIYLATLVICYVYSIIVSID